MGRRIKGYGACGCDVCKCGSAYHCLRGYNHFKHRCFVGEENRYGVVECTPNMIPY
jgi:hypothetical protein